MPFDAAIEAGRTAVRLAPADLQKRFNLANALAAAGRMDEAIAAYRVALCLFPASVDIWINLSIALERSQNLAAACRAGAHAVAAAPERAELHYNQANFLFQLGSLDAAEAAFAAAIARRPDFVDAYYNLGSLLLQRHRSAASRRHQRAVVALAPEHSRGWNNLGLLDFVDGRHETAPALCDRAIVAEGGKQTPDLANMLRNRLAFRLQATRTADWATVVRAQPLAGQPPESLFSAHVSSAIGHWAGGNVAAMDEDLDLADDAAQFIADWKQGNYAILRYFRDLMRLLRSEPVEERDGLAPAFIIGDSHSLSYAASSLEVGGRRHALAAELNMGCKAWHLGNGQGNRYKWRFEWLARQFPSGAPVVSCVGEIDCRLDGGLLPFLKRNGGDIGEVTAKQAAAYVGYVKRVLERNGHQAIIAGIPAPNLRNPLYQTRGASQEDLSKLIAIIAAFNQGLRAACAAAGLGFIDLYAATAGEDGVSHGRRHIDIVHLRPASLIAG